MFFATQLPEDMLIYWVNWVNVVTVTGLVVAQQLETLTTLWWICILEPLQIHDSRSTTVLVDRPNQVNESNPCGHFQNTETDCCYWILGWDILINSSEEIWHVGGATEGKGHKNSGNTRQTSALKQLLFNVRSEVGLLLGTKWNEGFHCSNDTGNLKYN